MPGRSIAEIRSGRTPDLGRLAHSGDQQVFAAVKISLTLAVQHLTDAGGHDFKTENRLAKATQPFCDVRPDLLEIPWTDLDHEGIGPLEGTHGFTPGTTGVDLEIGRAHV